MEEPYLYRVRAIADYTPATESEVHIKAGEIYEIYEADERNIWLQTYSDDKYGWFPASFAEPIEDDVVNQNTEIVDNNQNTVEELSEKELQPQIDETEQNEINQDNVAQEIAESNNVQQENSVQEDVSLLDNQDINEEVDKPIESIQSQQPLSEVNNSSTTLIGAGLASNHSANQTSSPQTETVEQTFKDPSPEEVKKEVKLNVDIPTTQVEPLIHSSSPKLSRSLSKSGGKKSHKKLPLRRASTTDATKVKMIKKKSTRKKKKGRRPTPSLITEEKNKKNLPCTLHIQSEYFSFFTK